MACSGPNVLADGLALAARIEDIVILRGEEKLRLIDQNLGAAGLQALESRRRGSDWPALDRRTATELASLDVALLVPKRRHSCFDDTRYFGIG